MTIGSDGPEFVKGEKYTNRKGTYVVVELHPPTMRVRYDDGYEETVDMVIQQRILRNMALPPRTPEPPPRRRISGAPAPKPAPKAAPKAAPAAGAATAPARRTATPRTTTAAGRRRAAAPAPVINVTVAQLAAMAEKEDQAGRQDLLQAVLASPATFQALLERSRAAERDRLHAFALDQVIRLHAADAPPTRQEPEQLLGYAIAQNRAYLAAEGQEILAWHFPLYETGLERYVIDLLCYDEPGRRAMLVCTRIKSTGRHWLWETLLDGLRNWAAVVSTADFPAALAGYALEAPPQLVILAPAAFWADNAAGAGAHTAEVAAGHVLNRRLLAAVEDWAGISVLLLQVPDSWLRTIDELDQPTISPAPFARTEEPA